ncbi:Putative methyl-accepting chemotaxis protein YoaH [Paenibacillus solanacearum]|uniref:Methyl-accepting chemotaxis protein YoaH n=1 Tax=Paenibacillus solanacearum TaxID=2048548 RepID=A0A916K5V9_9BACL|nr:methyl-accepting chemotaxis protein [Paenibacillus solanacearum]CAG7635788.1 Putative methyl-accepting chemotaxis protein YoaH [Paenibacillus solanacearum]
MKWFHDLKISVKFIGCFVAILVILTIGNLTGLINTNRMNDNLVDLYDNDYRTIKDLGDISSSYHRINTAVGSYLLLSDSESRKKEKEAILAKQQVIDELLSRFESRDLTDEERKELSLFRQLWNTYPKTIEKVLALADEGQDAFARSLYEKEMLTREDGIDRTFQGFIELNQEKADSRFNESMRRYGSIKWSTLLIMLFSLLISGLLGSLMTFSIMKPVRLLLGAFKHVEDGDLSRELSTERRDELGRLAAGFETMRQSIASIVSQTKRSVHRLSDLSGHIRGYAQTTGETSQEMNKGMQLAAAASDAQAGNVSEDTVVIREMSTGLKQVATHIDEVSSLSSDMERASSEGRLVVAGALDSMTSILLKSQQTGSIVQELGSHSAEIDGIMSTMRQIAEETNLLALNASIEAARAGEAGNGFAVVALEVRKLSESSKASAQYVGSVIARIQESTRDLLASTQAWTTELHQGQTKVNEVSASFSQIYEWIQHMNDRIQDITAGIEEMAAGSEQMDASMRRIEAYADQVSQTNRQYADQSGEQARSMDEINMSVEELLNVSRELSTLVNRFVIK